LAQYVEILGNNHILETKNFAELGQILKLMYDNSAEREATTAIRLFGMLFTVIFISACRCPLGCFLAKG
jgi:hypothetical protein